MSKPQGSDALALADDLDCCPKVGSDVLARVVPEHLCQMIVAELRDLVGDPH